jgi:hypothetical protein
MRVFFIFSVLFLISCGGSSPKKISADSSKNNSINNMSAKKILHQQNYWQLLDTFLFPTAHGQQIEISRMRKGKLNYWVIAQDTIPDHFYMNCEYCNFSLKHDLYRGDLSDYFECGDSLTQFHVPLKVFTENDLTQLVSLPDNQLQNYNWIIDIKDSLNEKNIYATRIYPVQLDSDKQKERIVELDMNQFDRYLVYDDKPSGWVCVDSVDEMFRFGLRPIDFSLKGYFGLYSAFGGTGDGSVYRDFFRLTPDSIQLCFYVNDFCKDYMNLMSPDEGPYINSIGKLSLVNSSTIKADYNVNFGLTKSGDTIETEILRNEHVIWYFQKNEDFTFSPPKDFPQLDSATEGNCQFDASVYVCKRLWQLKKGGTKRQKRLLENFTLKEFPDWR